jgi:hypothetical protein
VFSVVLYAVTAVYFAGVMVRLMLTLTPVVCVLSGIAFSYTYERYLVDEAEPTIAVDTKKGKSDDESVNASAGTGGTAKQLYDKANHIHSPFILHSRRAKPRARRLPARRRPVAIRATSPASVLIAVRSSRSCSC